MSSKKCVYKIQENNEEPDSLTSPCFQINIGVELKDTPSNGEEYLLKVIKERQKYAFVSKCNKDITKFAKNQSRFVKELHHAKAPLNLKPTIEWQNIQVADFSETRMYISRMLIKKSLWPSKVKKIDINPNNVEAWKSLVENQDPTLSSLIGVHSAVIDRGLEILIEILGEVKPGTTIRHRTGQWIYAFLACIRQPLLSDTTSILRDLARKCAEIRNWKEPSPKLLLLNTNCETDWPLTLPNPILRVRYTLLEGCVHFKPCSQMLNRFKSNKNVQNGTCEDVDPLMEAGAEII